ncbi:MAG: hypothetical protein IKK51_03420 [Oscillospiraceae bacterium]|nr:hypothetical protein [Oscillospiraceae bacterium]
MKGCIYCGTKWKEGDVCPNCGRPADSQDQKPARDGDGKSGTVWIVLVLVIGLVLFLQMASYELPGLLYDMKREKSLASQREMGIFESGSYEIGKDIPAGEYAAVLSDDAPTEVFHLYVYASAIAPSDSELMSDVFHECRLLVLEEGQYIELIHATLYDMEKNAHPLDPFSSSGMYKVGRDLEPGTYTVEGTRTEWSGVYWIYSGYDYDKNNAYESGIVKKDEKVQVELHEGEYIEMRDCCLKP